MSGQLFNSFLARAVRDYLTGDIRAALLMSATTASAQNDGIQFVGDFTTLDECDAAGYARVSLTSEDVAVDDANDRAVFDADDLTFSGLGGDATRDYVGVLVYRHVTDDSDSEVIAFVQFAVSEVKTVTAVPVQWSSAGLMLFERV